MRKALVRTGIAIVLGAGCGVVITMTSDNANACTKLTLQISIVNAVNAVLPSYGQ